MVEKIPTEFTRILRSIPFLGVQLLLLRDILAIILWETMVKLECTNFLQLMIVPVRGASLSAEITTQNQNFAGSAQIIHEGFLYCEERLRLKKKLEQNVESNCKCDLNHIIL